MANWVPVILGPPRKLGTPPTSKIARISALYSCRVPIINGLLLLLLPVVCLGLAPTLLKNLLVMTPRNLLWSTAAAYVLSWSIQLTYRVIAINRAERLFLPGPPAATPASAVAKLITRVLPFPLLLTIIFLRGENDTSSDWFTYLLAAAGGFGLAYILAFFAVFLAALVAPPDHVRATDFFTLPWQPQQDLLNWASRLPFVWKPARLAGLQTYCQHFWPNGYFDQEGRLYGGHWIALASFTLSLILYLGLAIAKSPDVPALSYVLQLQFLVVWALSGTSFFLDRFRIPVIAPLALGTLVYLIPSLLPASWPPRLAWLPSSDHFYEMWKTPASQKPLPPPAQVLDNFLKKTRSKVTVVATAGGGIQAAAWTAEVLTQLQALISPPPDAPSFADSIAVLSGVSGGAVGMMFFGARYQGHQGSTFPTDPTALQNIVSEAETPTLNDVAGGLTGADVRRVIIPFVQFGPWKLDDRGSALENAWKRTIGDVSLLAWTQGVGDAFRPAFIFNSTIAETGEPFLFGTTGLTYSPQTIKTDSKFAQRRTFFSEYPEYDVGIVTAARMAASFPFVTPAARPLKDGPAHHLVDGGYYDNYGLNSLLAWLAEAIDNLPAGAPKPEVLVLEIRSFPTEELKEATWKTWLYQVYAPVDGLYNVRETGQSLRDAEELKEFEAAYANKATFVNAPFEFPGEHAPLSWQMNRSQKEAVCKQWNSQTPIVEIVQKFIGGTTRPAQQVCDAPPH